MLGLILAGGKSSRMGKDKALIKVKRKTILDNTAEILDSYSDEVFISINSNQRSEPNRSKYQTLVDQSGLKGPMAGILSAAMHDSDSAWIIVSCDLPLLDRSTIQYLIEKRAKDKYATFYASNKNDIEPLCGIYEPRLLKMLISDPSIIIKMSPQLTLRKMDIEVIDSISSDALFNLNRMTPKASNIIDNE